MTRPTRLVAAVLGLVTALSLTACGSDSGAGSGSGSGKGENAAASSSVTLTLGDQAKSLQTLVNASGAFKGIPYKVKWAEFEGAAPLFQAAQAGATDTTYAADLPTLQAMSGGVPIKGLAALKNDGSAVGIVVQKDSKVRTVADLKGKKVVVSSARGSIAEYLLANALKEAGLSYSDVTVQYLLPTDAQAGFSSGKFDVWATFGVYQAVALGQGARQLVDGRDGRVSGYGFIGATDKALADKSKQAALRDVLKRVATALQWARTHQDAYAAAITKNNGASAQVAKTIAGQSYGELVPITPEVTKAVQRVADTMHDIKVLDPSVDVAKAVDTGYFE